MILEWLLDKTQYMIYFRWYPYIHSIYGYQNIKTLKDFLKQTLVLYCDQLSLAPSESDVRIVMHVLDQKLSCDFIFEMWSWIEPGDMYPVSKDIDPQILAILVHLLIT